MARCARRFPPVRRSPSVRQTSQNCGAARPAGTRFLRTRVEERICHHAAEVRLPEVRSALGDGEPPNHTSDSDNLWRFGNPWQSGEPAAVQRKPLAIRETAERALKPGARAQYHGLHPLIGRNPTCPEGSRRTNCLRINTQTATPKPFRRTSSRKSPARSAKNAAADRTQTCANAPNASSGTSCVRAPRPSTRSSTPSFRNFAGRWAERFARAERFA